MPTPRFTFHLDPADATVLYQLAERYQVPVAQLCRDAVSLLLSDRPAYERALMALALERFPTPTPAQEAAAAQRMRDALAIDLTALYASLPDPPPS
jgi:hypothetical protein